MHGSVGNDGAVRQGSALLAPPVPSQATGHGPHHLGSRCDAAQPRPADHSSAMWAAACCSALLSLCSVLSGGRMRRETTATYLAELS